MTQAIQANDTVLFQGDSITNAFRRPEEVNNAYQLGSGYALMVAARLLAERPADNLRFLNRGVSGNRLDQMAARWDADAIALRPTVISILIGINDVGCEVRQSAPVSPEQFDAAYRALLARTQQALPDVRFVLCEPNHYPVNYDPTNKAIVPSLALGGARQPAQRPLGRCRPSQSDRALRRG
jgi:lysophospholipase L1-like esterase